MSVTIPKLTPGEQARREKLRVMRRVATALFAFVTVAFLAVRLWGADATWVGYLEAALEASMVGALADWFAVTALFRHPLGLPIPHTAIIPERKEQFGQTLATFFRENFLSGATVADRVRTSAAVARASTWLADAEHATPFVRNVLQRSGS